MSKVLEDREECEREGLERRQERVTKANTEKGKKNEE